MSDQTDEDKTKEQEPLTAKEWGVLGIMLLVIIGVVASCAGAFNGGGNSKAAGYDRIADQAPAAQSPAPTSTDSPTSEPNTDQTTPAPELSGRVKLLRKRSSCYQPYPGAAITVYAAFRNTTGQEQDVNLIPVRHYDDGQSNDSMMDEVTVSAGTGFTMSHGEFEVGSDHMLVGCELWLVDSNKRVPVKVNVG